MEGFPAEQSDGALRAHHGPGEPRKGRMAFSERRAERPQAVIASWYPFETHVLGSDLRVIFSKKFQEQPIKLILQP